MSLYERIHGRRPDPTIARERAAFILANQYDKAVALGDLVAVKLLRQRIVRWTPPASLVRWEAR
jgi:hypothetical protein